MSRLLATCHAAVRRDDEGQTMAETALILALASIMAAAGAALVGPGVLTLWQRAVDTWP